MKVIQKRSSVENEIENVLRWFDSVKDDILRFYPIGHMTRQAIYYQTIYHRAIWASAVLENIVIGIKAEDDLAIQLGCQFIIDDPFRIPFGKIKKSNIGRALKSKASLIKETDRVLIIRKVIQFLHKGIAPQEVKVYCKLIKKFELQKFVEEISKINTDNLYARRLKNYLLGIIPI